MSHSTTSLQSDYEPLEAAPGPPAQTSNLPLSSLNDEIGDLTFLRHFIRVALIANTITVAIAGLIYSMTRVPVIGVVMVALALASMGILLVARMLARHQYNRAGITIYMLGLFFGFTTTLLVPEWLASSVVTPLLMVVVCMPFMSRKLLRWMFIISWLATIALIWLATNVRLFDSTSLATGLPMYVGVLHVLGLTLLLLWRYHTHLSWVLERSQQANSTLREVRSTLENTVLERTAELREREARFRAITELTSDSALFLRVNPDRSFAITDVIDQIASVTGYDSAILLAPGALQRIVNADDLVRMQAGCDEVMAGHHHICEARITHASGEIRWLRAYARPQWDETEQRVSSILVAFQNITDRRKYEEQIEQLAFYDSLTGLANRRFYQDSAIAALRAPDATCAVLFLDLDRFKTVNDTLGHDMGDELLQQVAARLRDSIGDEILLARLGGDEFAVLLANSTANGAIAVAQRLHASLDTTFHVRGNVLRVTASIGIACSPNDGQEFSTLLKHADIAMYSAKRRGQPVGIYDPGLETFQIQRLQLEADLRRALDRDELVLYYQPICAIPSRHMLRMEALVRWRHPDAGMVSPGLFIPIAEECGLIRELDRWVVRHALQQLGEWHASGLPYSVTINLSGHSLQDMALISEIADWLQTFGVPAEQVTIEVTESTAMIDIDTTMRLLQHLSQLGLSIALDDFGTGHASLSRLKDLPVSMLKVDRSFVSGIGKNAKDEGVLQALVILSRGMGLELVAEGVETTEQCSWLTEAGYTLAQGYLFGRPMPAVDLPLAHARLGNPDTALRPSIATG